MTESVLITGHRGYIGALMTPALVAAGYRVVGMDCGFYEDSGFYGELCTVEEIPRDIRVARAEDFDGIDAVIHLAALSNDPTGDLDASATDSINRQGTRHVAELARQQGVKRFLFLSSCSLYGASGLDLIDETAAPAPISPYGVSKVDSERDLAALNGDDFAVTFLRGGTAYGASPRLRMDLLINDLVASAVCFNRIELLSDGSAWRPLVHIADFVDAAAAVLRAPRQGVAGQAFNIGRTDQNFKVLDVAHAVNRQIPDAELVIRENASQDARSYRVSCDKAHNNIPGLGMGWTVESGIGQLERVCRERLASQGTWTRQQFSRVARLKQLISSGQVDLNDPEQVSGFARGALESA